MEMFMLAIQILLAVVFGAAGAMKLLRTKEQLEHNPQFSEKQVRLLGIAEVGQAAAI